MAFNMVAPLFLVLLAIISTHFLQNQGEWFHSYMSARHEAGVCFNVLKRPLYNSWISQIGNYPLLLGELPIMETGDLLPLLALQVTEVVILLEPFEREPGYLVTPISDAIYEAHNISVTWYHVKDHYHLGTSEVLHRMVKTLHKTLQRTLPGITSQTDPETDDEADDSKTYVHCRSGIGRSASLVVAFLMYSEKRSFPEVYHEVRMWRPQVKLNDRQRHALENYDRWLGECRIGPNREACL
jgi:protein-tyrosine phosphatase